MIEYGFIQLHRKMTEWEWYTNTNTKALFIHLLLKANFIDKKWQGKLVKRGSFITSYNKLSIETGLSVKNVRTALEHLEMTNEVAKSKGGQNTQITLLNYDKYQSIGKPADTQTASESAHKGQTNGTQVATTNKENKENKENNISSESDLFNIFYNCYPKKADKKPATIEFNKLTNQEQEKIVEVVSSDFFKEYYKQFENRYIPSPRKFLEDRKWEDVLVGKGGETQEEARRKEHDKKIEEELYFKMFPEKITSRYDLWEVKRQKGSSTHIYDYNLYELLSDSDVKDIYPQFIEQVNIAKKG